MNSREIIAYIDTTFDDIDRTIKDYLVSIESKDYDIIEEIQLKMEYDCERLEMYIMALRDKLNESHC